jgi:hypothetical protein
MVIAVMASVGLAVGGGMLIAKQALNGVRLFFH